MVQVETNGEAEAKEIADCGSKMFDESTRFLDLTSMGNERS